MNENFVQILKNKTNKDIDSFVKSEGKDNNLLHTIADEVSILRNISAIEYEGAQLEMMKKVQSSDMFNQLNSLGIDGIFDKISKMRQGNII